MDPIADKFKGLRVLGSRAHRRIHRRTACRLWWACNTAGDCTG